MQGAARSKGSGELVGRRERQTRGRKQGRWRAPGSSPKLLNARETGKQGKQGSAWEQLQRCPLGAAAGDTRPGTEAEKRPGRQAAHAARQPAGAAQGGGHRETREREAQGAAQWGGRV